MRPQGLRLHDEKTVAGFPLVRFGQISDTHLRADTRLHREVDTQAALRQAVSMVDSRLDFVVHTGDIVSRPADAASYALYHSIVESLRCPLWHVPGNHDDAVLLREHLGRGSLECPWCFTRSGVRFMGLDSSTGAIPADGLERLESLLRGSEAAVVFLHHHICPMPGSWLDAFGLVNSAALCSVLAAYASRVLGVLHGHIHHDAVFGCGGVAVHSAPALSNQFDPYGEFLATLGDGPAFVEFAVWPDGTLQRNIRRCGGKRR